MLKALGLFPALLLWSSLASAATYYVNDDGSHGSNCSQYQNISTPAATILDGIACTSGGGDTVLVRAGTYAEAIWSPISGPYGNVTVPAGTSWNNKVRIANYPNGCSPTLPLSSNGCTPGEEVWLAPTSVSQFAGAVIKISTGAAYVEFDGINIDARPSGQPGSGQGYGGTGIATGPTDDMTAHPHHLRFQNLEVYAGDCGVPLCERDGIVLGQHTTGPNSLVGGYEVKNVYVHSDQTPDPRGYAVYVETHNSLVEGSDLRMGNAGLQIYNGSGGNGSRNNIARNNRIHGMTVATDFGRCWGILVSDNNNQIYNNIIYDNTPPYQTNNAAIYVYYGDGNLIANNTIYNNSMEGITIDGSVGATNTKVWNNIIYANAHAAYTNNGSGTSSTANSIGVNPNFANAGTGDFHLTASSTAVIDTGCNTGQCPGVPATDADGVARPQGASLDIGAYEFNAVSGLPPGVATNFVPVNGATNVNLFDTLTWTTGTNTDSFDIYYGSFFGVGPALFADVFARANSSDLGTNWTPYTVSATNAQLVSNAAFSTSTSLDSIERVSTLSLHADQWSRAQVSTLSPTGIVAVKVMLRMQAGTAASGYEFAALKGVSGTTSFIQRLDNGAETILASENATTWVAGDYISATVVGSTLNLYRNGFGTPILTANDPTYTSGTAGLSLYASSSVGGSGADNFDAGDIGPVFVVNQTGTSWATPAQNPSSSYYWRIVSRNAFGVTAGPDLQFTTLGNPATPIGIRLRFKCITGMAQCP